MMVVPFWVIVAVACAARLVSWLLMMSGSTSGPGVMQQRECSLKCVLPLKMGPVPVQETFTVAVDTFEVFSSRTGMLAASCADRKLRSTWNAPSGMGVISPDA